MMFIITLNIMSIDRKIILDSIPLNITDNQTFEDIISQIQPYVTDSIVVVVNGEKLVLHMNGDKSKFPMYVELETIRGDVYYFRDKTTDDLHALFGAEAATIYCPSLNKGTFRRKIASIRDDDNVTTVLDNNVELAIVSERVIEISD